MSQTARITPREFIDLKVVKVSCFGRDQGIDWRLAEPGVAPIVGQIARSHGVSRIVAPDSDFSARVCDRSELSIFRKINVGGTQIPILSGTNADGVEIYKNEAYVLTSGDCPTLIVFDEEGDRVVCAHAGRDSVIDRRRVIGNGQREHQSVVDACINQFDKEVWGRLRFHIACGIDGKSYRHMVTHPENGRYYKKMIEYVIGLWGGSCFEGDLALGCLSIKTLIKCQLMVDYNISEQRITFDSINTYEDRDHKGNIWWSNRRGDQQRNMAFVHHN